MGHRWAAVLLLTEIAGQVEPGTGDLRLIPGLLGVGVQALEDGGRLIGRMAGGEVHDHSPAGQGDWAGRLPITYGPYPRAPTPCSQSQIVQDCHLRRRGRALVECAAALSVVVRWEPVRTVVNGRLVARPGRRPTTDWRPGFHADRRVRPVPGDQRLLGKPRTRRGSLGETSSL